MDKMKQETADLTQENIERIGELFPNVITEMKDENGKLKKGINFELLKQLLSGNVVDGEECYDFTWVGKKASIVEANTPIRKTLRPCIEDSKNWETTENLYIEGDNLDVLKLLQESYLNSIKMIYIDPPYNTGKDFIYKDKFMIDKDEYEEQIGMYDEVGNRLFQNKETEGRFHSNWCSMMYPRLKLARSLLTEDGVIFISIDDNEVQNLRKICDEIFGEENFVSTFVWKRRVSSAMADNNVSSDHDYVISYQKGMMSGFRGIEKDFRKYSNPDNDPRGPWILDNLTVGMTKSMRPNQAYNLVDPSTGKVYPFNPNRVWAFIPESMKKMIDEGRIVFPEDTSKRPMQKRFKNELKSVCNPFSTIMIDVVGLNTEATRVMQETMGGNIFEYSKPTSLLRTLIYQMCDDGEIVLDFFSGSATTAHAAMQLNAEDGGNRKFIMVQLPEPCDEKSEAFKAGYKNICEIGKERIRRSGDKINKEIEESNRQLKLGEEPKKPVDIGFRVLKVDTTNMKDIYYAASAYSQNLLTDQISNIKEDRTDLDLLYGVLLEWGLPLSLKHEIEEIDGIKIHIVDNDSLIACFAENISEAVVREIAKRQPLRAIFRDSSFASSSDKINVEEIFKLLAPNTSVKVI